MPLLLGLLSELDNLRTWLLAQEGITDLSGYCTVVAQNFSRFGSVFFSAIERGPVDFREVI